MNLRKELNKLDHKALNEETEFYDLVSLYEGCILSDTEKKKLAESIEKGNTKECYNTLSKNFNKALNEDYLDMDDIDSYRVKDPEEDKFKKVKERVKLLADAIHDFEDDLSDFYITYSFGMDEDDNITGGVDLRFDPSKEDDKELIDNVKSQLEELFNWYGFVFDKRFTNPRPTLTGGFHYQIIDDQVKNEFLDDDEKDNIQFIDTRKNSIVRGDDDYGFDEYDLKQSKLDEDLSRIYYKVISDKGEEIFNDQQDEYKAERYFDSLYNDDDVRRAELYIVKVYDEEIEDDVLWKRFDKDEYQKYLTNRLKEKGLVEARSYGGAFDIADDQLFTREELDEFGYELAYKVEDQLNKPIDYVSSYIDDGFIEVTLSYDEYEVTLKRKLDMRAIRKPSDINKYHMYFVPRFEEEFKEIIPYYNESMNEDSHKR